MLPLANATEVYGHIPAEENDSQMIAAQDKIWYDNPRSTDEYYAVVREAILRKFQKFDFSDYEGKEGVVKIDFELMANGSPKSSPEFLGTQDEKLKDLLNKCFKDAMPFPPFPKGINKKSQRFSLAVSFKNG